MDMFQVPTRPISGTEVERAAPKAMYQDQYESDLHDFWGEMDGVYDSVEEVSVSLSTRYDVCTWRAWKATSRNLRRSACLHNLCACYALSEC
eukprot:1554130-Rhodomonas_salina.2